MQWLSPTMSITTLPLFGFPVVLVSGQRPSPNRTEVYWRCLIRKGASITHRVLAGKVFELLTHQLDQDEEIWSGIDWTILTEREYDLPGAVRTWWRTFRNETIVTVVSPQSPLAVRRDRLSGPERTR